jgi:hypothetical protein
MDFLGSMQQIANSFHNVSRLECAPVDIWFRSATAASLRYAKMVQNTRTIGWGRFYDPAPGPYEYLNHRNFTNTPEY